MVKQTVEDKTAFEYLHYPFLKNGNGICLI